MTVTNQSIQTCQFNNSVINYEYEHHSIEQSIMKCEQLNIPVDQRLINNIKTVEFNRIVNQTYVSDLSSVKIAFNHRQYDIRTSKTIYMPIRFTLNDITLQGKQQFITQFKNIDHSLPDDKLFYTCNYSTISNIPHKERYEITIYESVIQYQSSDEMIQTLALYYQTIPNLHVVINGLEQLINSILDVPTTQLYDVEYMQTTNNNNLNIIIRSLNKQLMNHKMKIIKQINGIDIESVITSKFANELYVMNRVKQKYIELSKTLLYRIIDAGDHRWFRKSGVMNIETTLKRDLNSVNVQFITIQSTYNSVIKQCVNKVIKQNYKTMNSIESINNDIAILKQYINGCEYEIDNVDNDELYEFMTTNEIYEDDLSIPTAKQPTVELSLLDQIVNASCITTHQTYDCYSITKEELGKILALKHGYRFKSIPTEFTKLSVAQKFIMSNGVQYFKYVV